MQKIWQTEWFNIKFNEFTDLNPDKIADSEFYKKFYELFFKKYQSYDDIDDNWKIQKKNVALDIYSNIKKNESYSILSIGCGIGYIEKCIKDISDKNKDNLKLTALDPNQSSKCWIKDFLHFKAGYFPESVKKMYFDLVFFSNIDYAMNDDDYILFLKSIYEFKVPRLILAYLSKVKNNWSTFEHLKEIIKPLYHKLKPHQFWGYLRSIDEHIDLLNKAGFSQFEIGKHQQSNQNYWISAT